MENAPLLPCRYSTLLGSGAAGVARSGYDGSGNLVFVMRREEQLACRNSR